MNIDPDLLRTVRRVLSALSVCLVAWVFVLVAIKDRDPGIWFPVTFVVILVEVGVEGLYLRTKRDE